MRLFLDYLEYVAIRRLDVSGWRAGALWFDCFECDCKRKTLTRVACGLPGRPQPQLVSDGATFYQVLHLNNLTTEEQHVTRRTWVRVPMTAQDHHSLFG